MRWIEIFSAARRPAGRRTRGSEAPTRVSVQNALASGLARCIPAPADASRLRRPLHCVLTASTLPTRAPWPSSALWKGMCAPRPAALAGLRPARERLTSGLPDGRLWRGHEDIPGADADRFTGERGPQVCTRLSLIPSECTFPLRSVHNVWRLPRPMLKQTCLRHRLGWPALGFCARHFFRELERLSKGRGASKRWFLALRWRDGTRHCPVSSNATAAVNASAVCIYAQAKKSARGKERKQSVKAVRSSAPALPACLAFK